MDALASPPLALLQFALIAGLVLTAGLWLLYFWLKYTGRLPRKPADPASTAPAIETADQIRLAQCAQHLGISETRALQRAIARFHTTLFAENPPGNPPHPALAQPPNTPRND